jgi:regulatory protein
VSRRRPKKRSRRIRSTRAPSRSDPPLERAVRLLAGRDFTAEELDRRLERAGVDPAERREVLDRLAGAGYLDDERVVRDRAVRLADRGYGDAAIRLDLERRGAAPELTEQTIAALEPERSRADRLVEKLGGGVRTARTLARKGFSEASVERALAAVAQDTRGGLG